MRLMNLGPKNHACGIKSLPFINASKSYSHSIRTCTCVLRTMYVSRCRSAFSYSRSVQLWVDLWHKLSSPHWPMTCTTIHDLATARTFILFDSADICIIYILYSTCMHITPRTLSMYIKGNSWQKILFHIMVNESYENITREKLYTYSYNSAVTQSTKSSFFSPSLLWFDGRQQRLRMERDNKLMLIYKDSVRTCRAVVTTPSAGLTYTTSRPRGWWWPPSLMK